MEVKTIEDIPTAHYCREISEEKDRIKTVIVDIFNEYIKPAMEAGEYSAIVKVGYGNSDLIKGFFEIKGFRCRFGTATMRNESYEDKSELIIEW